MTALHTLGILSTSFMPYLESISINMWTLLMCLSQSVVLWQGRGGIQKIALFGKRTSPYYGKNSWNKQRETTVHHYFKTSGQSIRNISRTLNVSSSAVTKTIKHYDETGSHEERHRKGWPRVTSAAEDMFIRVTSPNFIPIKWFTEFKYQTDLNISCSEETEWIKPSW